MKKTWIIFAASLTVAGALIFVGVMSMLKWDFKKLSTDRYVENSYAVSEEFTDISIHTDTARITFVPADGAARVDCREEEHAGHTVGVRDGTLEIKVKVQKKWYHFIGINFDVPSLTVYLPAGAYGKLNIKSSTGDVDIPEEFSFESMDISLQTGDVSSGADVTGAMKLKTNTGHIAVTDVTCGGEVNVQVTTGKSTLTNVNCASLISTGNTGHMTLKNVIATEGFSIKRSTGDVKLEGCDAAEIYITTDTGDVTGSLLTEKVFITKTSTGRVNVPGTTTGGKCKITTSTGNIQITIQ